jgi:hypothetical protein
MDHIYKEDKFGEDWFRREELYTSFIKLIPDNSIFVEMGVWKGKSVAYLGVEIINSKKNIKCYAIDTFTGSQEAIQQSHPDIKDLYNIFLNNIEPIKDVVVSVKKASIDAVKDFKDKSIDIIFIDGDHSYEEVNRDIHIWFPKVKDGGIIAGHDYSLESVSRAVSNYFTSDLIITQGCWVKHL